VAQFLGLLVGLTASRKCLEVGVFTGYATLAIAMALPAGGRVIACDVDADAAAVGQPFWQEAGVADRIDLRIGAAGETLDGLIADGEAGSFDFAFIDADKTAYAGYYEQALTLLRPGGLVVVDNVLWGGSVANPEETKASTVALRSFAAKVHGDARVTMSLLPFGDGLILAVKRS
jgi:caffeoyl-CoA O-methyltransferase